MVYYTLMHGHANKMFYHFPFAYTLYLLQRKRKRCEGQSRGREHVRIICYVWYRYSTLLYICMAAMSFCQRGIFHNYFICLLASMQCACLWWLTIVHNVSSSTLGFFARAQHSTLHIHTIHILYVLTVCTNIWCWALDNLNIVASECVRRAGGNTCKHPTQLHIPYTYIMYIQIPNPKHCVYTRLNGWMDGWMASVH